MSPAWRCHVMGNSHDGTAKEVRHAFVHVIIQRMRYALVVHRRLRRGAWAGGMQACTWVKSYTER